VSDGARRRKEQRFEVEQSAALKEVAAVVQAMGISMNVILGRAESLAGREQGTNTLQSLTAMVAQTEMLVDLRCQVLAPVEEICRERG
jgi:hypothetical protein